LGSFGIALNAASLPRRSLHRGKDEKGKKVQIVQNPTTGRRIIFFVKST